MNPADTPDRGDSANGEEATSPDVVICIPTYRRPEQLARLLRALDRQRGGPSFEILIGNNDREPLTQRDGFHDDDMPRFAEIHVETRGVSAVRNAMIARVLATRPKATWIACLDDDQEPEDLWLERLVAAGKQNEADLVGGPVARTTHRSTLWSRGATDTSYLPRESGLVTTLNEAGNLLICTRYLRSLDREPFALDFGRTGGEDYEFFLHARSRGARIAWASDARVREPLPEDRVAFRHYIWRFYATAAYQARADRRYRGRRHALAAILKIAAKAPVAVVRALTIQRSITHAFGIVVQYLAMLAGRIVGTFGVRAERYGSDAS